ncbi:MAG: 50S ribosomal protein L17 [Planctomycetota bacterium]|jgi:large subunit ribosomal protein L17
MRHRYAGYKLNRTSSHRKALAKNMLRSFFLEFDRKGYIVTTRTKAKFIQPKVEKMISLARTKSVHNIRRAMAVIGDREAVTKLFDQIGPYYSERPGGYTRVLGLARTRLGDNAPRAYLGYVRDEEAVAVPAGDAEE